MVGGDSEPEAGCLARLHEVLGWLNDYLEETGYVAGTDHYTLADICVVSTLANICNTCDDLGAFPNVNQFMARMANQVPNYALINEQGGKDFGHGYHLRKNAPAHSDYDSSMQSSIGV